MFRRALDWLEERTGYRGVLMAALDEPVPGGPSFAYVFGSVLTFVLLLQIVTGILLAMYYSPSAQTAWASVAYIQDRVTLGWFVRGLHNHGASAMVIVSGLHMLQTAVYGAYKKPREVNWLVGVLMLGLILAFALTGYLLPWDQKGYWATKVATGIMGQTPLLGGLLQHLVQGGNEYGNLTLTRFFALHVFVLPGTILLLVTLHIGLFRRHGVTPHWKRTAAELAARSRPFWPDQLLRDMIAIAACFGVMALVTWKNHGTELYAPADPASGFDARPEWYFLPLFQLLKLFHGAMEQIAALGVPALVGAVLVLVPFFDRGPDRSPRKRAPFLAALGLLGVGAAGLTFMAMAADAGDRGFQKRRVAAEKLAARARELALLGVPPAGGTAVWENDPFFKAKRLFGERCAGCHVGNERKGPELLPGYNSRAWIQAFLKEPDNARFFGVTKGIHKMKPVKLQGDDLEAVVEMVYAETGAPDAKAPVAAKGKELFSQASCDDCHSLDGVTGGEEGPNLGGRGTVPWLTDMITDAKIPRLFGERNEMTRFGEKLTPAEIKALAAYVASLRDAKGDALDGAAAP